MELEWGAGDSREVRLARASEHLALWHAQGIVPDAAEALLAMTDRLMHAISARLPAGTWRTEWPLSTRKEAGKLLISLDSGECKHLGECFQEKAYRIDAVYETSEQLYIIDHKCGMLCGEDHHAALEKDRKSVV